jgi:hypothetical protein
MMVVRYSQENTLYRVGMVLVGAEAAVVKVGLERLEAVVPPVVTAVLVSRG